MPLTIISFTSFQIRHALNGIKAKQSKKGGIFTRKTKDDPIPPVMPPIGMLAVVTMQKFTYKTSCFGIMILLSKQSLYSLTSNTLTDANSGGGTSYPSGALGFKYCVLALK
jgi:hypothetical protein